MVGSDGLLTVVVCLDLVVTHVGDEFEVQRVDVLLLVH